MTTSARPAVDVSQLPMSAFGSRDPMWWGLAGIMAVEGTVFLLLLASYFYLRGNNDVFPPSRLLFVNQLLALVNVGIIVASVVPMHLTSKAAGHGRLGPMRLWLSLAALLGLAFLVVRVVELSLLPFRWDEHAYGSLFWLTMALHTVHLVAGSVENVVMLRLLFHAPLEEQQLVDVRTNALYWYFIVVAWLPTYAVLFLDPQVLLP